MAVHSGMQCQLNPRGMALGGDGIHFQDRNLETLESFCGQFNWLAGIEWFAEEARQYKAKPEKQNCKIMGAFQEYPCGPWGHWCINRAFPQRIFPNSSDQNLVTGTLILWFGTLFIMYEPVEHFATWVQASAEKRSHIWAKISPDENSQYYSFVSLEQEQSACPAQRCSWGQLSYFWVCRNL